jgi:small subunit ribosomal protein S20
MAKTSSAKKAYRVSTRRHVFNVRLKKTMKDAVKTTNKLIVAKKVKEVGASMSDLYQAIDKAAKHGTIKKNTAARMKSRIAKRAAVASK